MKASVLDRLVAAGGLTRYRIIGPDGRTIVASSPEAIGRQVVEGNFADVIKLGATTGEIKRVQIEGSRTAVIGRAIVPIMKGRTFLGVSAVSIDRTGRVVQHTQLSTVLALFRPSYVPV